MTDAGTRPPTPEELAALRAEVIAQVAPPAGRPEYAETDPAFVDPFVRAAVDARAGGGVPASGRTRADVVYSASSGLQAALATPEGLARRGPTFRPCC